MAELKVSSTIEHQFRMTVSGTLIEGEDGLYLETSDRIRLRVKKASTEPSDNATLWEAIPNTDSNGYIAMLGSMAEVTATVESDRCWITGRVVQLGKREPTVLVKIDRPGQKTLKLTLRNADARMKTGQLWHIEAAFSKGALAIARATPLIETSETNEPEEAIAPLNSSSDPKAIAPIQRARDILQAETGLDDWQLEPPKYRPPNTHSYSLRPRRKDEIETEGYWEWEARHPDSDRRLRLSLSSASHEILYYSQNAVLQPEANGQTESGSNGDRPANTFKDRLSVTPLGAARGIGASCFQVFIGPYEIVLDCGTRPKGYDPLPDLDRLQSPNLLLVSHAHQDHLGAVPVFHQQYPAVPIICTFGTREIGRIMLRDGLKVQSLNEDSPSLFDEEVLERCLWRLETAPVGTDFEPLPGLHVRFINAGHIPGAACIYLRYGERSLLYSGDFHTSNSKTTTGLKLSDLPEADIFICESTYGDGLHPSRKAQESALLEAVVEIVQQGGNVLIPAFALGRAQEILLAMQGSALFHKLHVPVYVDGLVRAVTDVFCEHLELLPEAIRNAASVSKRQPFFDNSGTPKIIPIADRSDRPLAMAKPSVIVASSGMLHGGPSVYYASTLLERENAAIFISGYTDEESPGRLLQNLQPGDTIELEGKSLEVKAQIRRFNLSAHADKVGLGQVIGKVNPKHLVLIHGDPSALHDLARSGDKSEKYYIHIPHVGDEISLDTIPDHLSRDRQAIVEQPQEFEVYVESFGEDVWLRLPQSALENDPRLERLIEFGVVKAKWAGNSLRLRRVSEFALDAETAIAKAEAAEVDCCAVCRFFSQGECQSPDSPLFERIVDPSGICQEFQLRAGLEATRDRASLEELVSTSASALNVPVEVASNGEEPKGQDPISEVGPADTGTEETDTGGDREDLETSDVKPKAGDPSGGDRDSKSPTSDPLAGEF